MQLLHDFHDPTITEAQREELKKSIADTKFVIRDLRTQLGEVKGAFFELQTTGTTSLEKVRSISVKLSDSFDLAERNVKALEGTSIRLVQVAKDNLDQIAGDLNRTSQDLFVSILADMQKNGEDLIKLFSDLTQEEVDVIRTKMTEKVPETVEEFKTMLSEGAKGAGEEAGEVAGEAVKKGFDQTLLDPTKPLFGQEAQTKLNTEAAAWGEGGGDAAGAGFFSKFQTWVQNAWTVTRRVASNIADRS